jgi:hypothetical protein
MSLKRFISARSSLFVAGLVLAAPACFSGPSAQGQSAPAPLSLKAGAQVSTVSQANATSVASAEEDSTPLKDDASHQGIKIHGHWKIVVKNPDGSIAQTREFENSLTAAGGNALAQFLSGALGNSSTGGLAIDLLSTGTTICGKANCGMAPNTTGGIGANFCITQNYCSPTALTTTVNGSSVLLAGQITATQSGTITSVATVLGVCDRSISPYTCQTTNAGGNNGTFTSTNITAIAVNAGQLVQVTVTISFS